MNEKIYISPSSQPANTYAVGNTNEQEQCRKIAAALQSELFRCGFIAKAGMSGTMYTRVAESNAFGAELHMPIHTNACDGKVAGLRIMIAKKGGEAEEIAKAIMATLAPITPGKSDGISVYPGLYEIKASKAICVYIEVGFHDNPEEAKWIIEHTKDIAAAIAKGLCNHYGVKHTEAKEETKEEYTEERIFYRVQVGAFTKKANAKKKLEAVKAAGFEDAFVVCVDNKIWRVQVGAYTFKENANKTLAKLNEAGFSGFVTKLGGVTVTLDNKRKSVEEIAKEVLKGLWGDGAERKKKLTEAGYSYKAVQDKVNELLK